MATTSSFSTLASHRLDRIRCDAALPGLAVLVQLASSCRTVGPIDHLSPTSRYKSHSPAQEYKGGGRKLRLDGGGDQLCVSIKLSFLSPSNGFPFSWFFGHRGPVGLVFMAPLLSLFLSLCPIYGNEPSALSITAAQMEEKLGGGRGFWLWGVSDRQESETKTLILLCLPLHQ